MQVIHNFVIKDGGLLRNSYAMYLDPSKQICEVIVTEEILDICLIIDRKKNPANFLSMWLHRLF